MFFHITIPQALLLLLITIFLGNLIPLLRNIRIAKASGLRYVIVPWYIYNFITARLMSRTFLRIVNRFSSEPTITSWRRLVVALWPLKLRHAPFAALGTDTFLTVAPGGIIIYTSDADVISQVLSRPSDFPKATQLYKRISIYGKNVVSAEGAMWRRHRKLTSPAFTERNNQLVWKATLEKSKAMLQGWVKPEAVQQSIQQVRKDTMRLSLEIIGRAGLGQDMEWSEDLSRSDEKGMPNGHTMSFTSSLQYICLHVITIVTVVQFLPAWLLKVAPWKTGRKSYEAYDNWGKYMEEIISTKKRQIRSREHQAANIDIIGQLIKGQDERHVNKGPDSTPLTDAEVMGNLFLFIQAGHETSASSIHLSILLLAMHPKTQSEVQRELDGIFRGRASSDWDYEKDLPKLLNGRLGAVMNEQLRLLGPVLTIPKVVTSKPQQIIVDGQEVTFPENTTMRLCSPSVHVNPNFWPHSPPTNPSKPAFALDNLDNDLEEFKPERWMRANPLMTPPSTPPSPRGSPTRRHPLTRSRSRQKSWTEKPNQAEAQQQYIPVKGSYLPFSDGQRICLGRRFAQVEVLAALASIFSEYSVELDVSSVAADEEIMRMSKEEKKRIWESAEEKAQWEWRNKLTCIITVQLTRDANIPLRFVKRGKERFFDLDR